MIRTLFLSSSAVVLLCWPGWLSAQDFFGERKTTKRTKPAQVVEEPAKGQGAKRAPVKRTPAKREPFKKDPVAAAFALPRGMVLDAEERQFYNQVRSKLEPRWRAALKRIEATEDTAEKRKIAKEIHEIKAQIKAAGNMVLQRRYMKAAQAYAKKMAEMRKKHASKGRGRGRGKKRRR